MTSLVNYVSLTIFLLAACLTDCSRRNVRGISSPRPTDDRIVFPGSSSSAVRFPDNRRPNANLQANQSDGNVIPVSIFLKNHIESTDDFIKTLVQKEGEYTSENTTILLRANFGGPVRNGDIAEMAHCKPTLTPVDLEKSTDPAVLYYPSCTRVERCGGCCNHDLLTCEPTKVENIKVKVLVARYDPEHEAFRREGVKTLELEKHVGCDCRCRVKEEDCNALQDYHPNECKCVCRNEFEIAQCSGELRFWDPSSCRCMCRTTKECSTGFYFDSKTCSCQSEGQVSPIFRVPSGIAFNKNRQYTYDVSWDADRRDRRNLQD